MFSGTQGTLGIVTLKSQRYDSPLDPNNNGTSGTLGIVTLKNARVLSTLGRATLINVWVCCWHGATVLIARLCCQRCRWKRPMCVFQTRPQKKKGAVRELKKECFKPRQLKKGWPAQAESPWEMRAPDAEACLGQKLRTE